MVVVSSSLTAESFRLTRTRLFPPFPCFPKNSPTLPFWITSLCVAPYSHPLFIHLLGAYDPVQPTRLCLPMSNCSHPAFSHFMSFSVSVAHNPVLSARITSHSDARDPFRLSLQQRCQCLPCIPGLINLSPHCKRVQVGVLVGASLRTHLDHLEISVSDNMAVITLHHWRSSEKELQVDPGSPVCLPCRLEPTFECVPQSLESRVPWINSEC